jgi:hypothetical protein
MKESSRDRAGAPPPGPPPFPPRSGPDRVLGLDFSSLQSVPMAYGSDGNVDRGCFSVQRGAPAAW